MKIIWALYDDGNMSWYYSTYDKSKYRVISIGIQEHNGLEDYHKIDLRLSNFDLIKQLSKLPKPDIIVASPPCESWSGADCKARIYNNDLTFKNESWYYDYNLNCSKNKKRNWISKVRNKIIGEDTLLGTIHIIKTFKPKAWVIENPKSSYLWKYINKYTNFVGINNDTCYNCYDKTFSKKPTRFFSNKKIELFSFNIKSNNRMNYCNYNERSAIPNSLLLDILYKLVESFLREGD